jgi:zinc transport system permease protein
MMDLWYRFVDAVLPFAWTGPAFMKNALLGILLITPLCGLAGTIVVSNRLAFFADSIGHSALTGVALGALLGLATPLPAVMLFVAIFAVAIVGARRITAESSDTVIGALAAFAVALGLVILSRGGSFARFSGILVGDVLTVGPNDLAFLAVVVAAAACLWLALYNGLVMMSVNHALARSRRMRVTAIEIAFLIILAEVVAVAIPWVGLLVVNALIVLPAAAARNISTGMRSFTLVSVAGAAASGVAGLALSYEWGSAAGPSVVIVAFAWYALTVAGRSLFKSLAA